MINCTVLYCGKEKTSKIGYCTDHYQEYRKERQRIASKKFQKSKKHLEYLEKTREKRLESYKIYRLKNINIERKKDKEYYYQNIDKISEYKIRYREENKEEINENTSL